MRFLFNSQALLRQLRPHRPAERVGLTIEDGCCTLLSSQGPTVLACEGRHNLTTTVDTQRLFAALLAIEDQPITLDLHEWRGARNVLYACKVHRHDLLLDTYEPIQFDL